MATIFISVITLTNLGSVQFQANKYLHNYWSLFIYFSFYLFLSSVTIHYIIQTKIGNKRWGFLIYGYHYKLSKIIGTKKTALINKWFGNRNNITAALLVVMLMVFCQQQQSIWHCWQQKNDASQNLSFLWNSYFDMFIFICKECPIFTRGQFWPSGIVIAPVCVSVSVCVCVSITCLSAR